MKNTLITLLLSICFTSFYAQDFYKSVKDEDFQLLISKGVHYIKTDKPEIDEAYIDALEKYWKISSFEIHESGYIPKNSDIIFHTDKMNGHNGEDQIIFLIIKNEILNKKRTEIYDAICGIVLNGFVKTYKPEVVPVFAPQTIIALNDGIALIHENNITKRGLGLPKDMNKLIKENSIALQKKKLLIVGDAINTANIKGLNASGINYERINLDSYIDLLEEGEMSDYCLYFCSENIQSDISIFDLGSNKMIYSKHFVNYRYEMGKQDFLDIVSSWE